MISHFADKRVHATFCTRHIALDEDEIAFFFLPVSEIELLLRLRQNGPRSVQSGVGQAGDGPVRPGRVVPRHQGGADKGSEYRFHSFRFYFIYFSFIYLIYFSTPARRPLEGHLRAAGREVSHQRQVLEDVHRPRGKRDIVPTLNTLQSSCVPREYVRWVR